MATDTAAILRNLLGFYDFRDKTVVAVGAGGGQLAGYATAARRVVAVDPDRSGLERLRDAACQLGVEAKFEFVAEPFDRCATEADVVLFEFSLHEMTDPAAALARAAALAPDTVVIDHVAGSPWAYCSDEDRKAEKCWNAAEEAGIAGRCVFETEQRFRDFDELRTRFLGQGAESRRRIESFRGEAAIEIPMIYAIARLTGSPRAVRTPS